MILPDEYFEVTDQHNCPMYAKGDRFYLSGKALQLDDENGRSFVTTAVVRVPKNKETCRVLVGDFNHLLVKHETTGNIKPFTMSCSGCTGMIRLNFKRSSPARRSKSKKPIETLSPSGKSDNIGSTASLLNIFPMFQPLSEKDIRDIIPMLKIKKFAKGTTIIKKGDPSVNLYIIAGGKVEISRDGQKSPVVLERGEIFGEITLLTGSPASATIRALEFVTALVIYGRDFKRVLDRFPSLQMYFARLLAERLSKTREKEGLNPGLSGTLDEMPTAELFQTLNLNHKTGILTLDFPGGTAKAIFYKGRLTGAEYAELKGAEAFFLILKEKKGRFVFAHEPFAGTIKTQPLGDFMWLLMEGIRRIDPVG